MSEQLWKCQRWNFDREEFEAIEILNLTKELADMYKESWEEEAKKDGHRSTFSVIVKPMVGNE